jgi:hypothetical protein
VSARPFSVIIAAQVLGFGAFGVDRSSLRALFLGRLSHRFRSFHACSSTKNPDFVGDWRRHLR